MLTSSMWIDKEADRKKHSRVKLHLPLISSCLLNNVGEWKSHPNKYGIIISDVTKSVNNCAKLVVKNISQVPVKIFKMSV